MEELIKTPKVKICGITSIREADFLNEAGADYAGFVFFEKSKRNISLAEAQMIGRSLYPGILKVAVTVSPSAEQVKEISQAGFDLLQVHGELTEDALRASELPVWRAVNISALSQMEQVFLREQETVKERLEGYVADGAGYGSGKPFDWAAAGRQILTLTAGKKLILAGGLTGENVREGIRYFHPDVVDVSSSVEDSNGKSKAKIEAFIRKVRENE